jgi:thioredoxin 1
MRRLTDGNFESEVVESGVPVLVDFFAPWCGPCRALGPIVEQIAAEYGGRLRVGKLNTDENDLVPTRYRIQAVPTLLLFQVGKVVDRVLGAVPRARIESMLRPFVTAAEECDACQS